MTEYINKDFYKQIPSNERHYINLNSANADEMIRQLKAAGIEFSATLGNYRRTVTVRKSDSERADAILNSVAKPQSQQNNSRIIGNTEYRYIADKKYINTDTKTAMQIANLLSGDTNCRFSGRIVGDRATITVSGDKNAAVIRRMIENLNNTDIIEALREAGYERIPDTNGFVNIKNTETGVVCGFDGMDMVRDMFNDPENEFFHPTAYRIELTTDAFAEPYYIAEYDVRSGEEKSAYYDSNGISPVFVTLDDAVSYTEKNKIAVTNTEAELNEWRAAERDREDAAIVMANNQLIQQFPMQDGNYPDDFIYNPDSGNYSWVFFNPDGNEGNGEFCEKTITPQDIYEAYIKRISAANEKDGRNAFIDHLYATSEESTIETGSGYFLDYADDYISKSDNTVRFYGIYANGNENDISAFIKYLEDNCDVVKDKENRQNTINEQSDEIIVDGYKGTWYVIDSQIIDGKNYFLLESENYGDEAAGIIIDENRNVIMDDVWNGFLDYHEKFDNITPEEKLADKVEAEWNAFLENMKKKSPDMLIESAYEISTKKNIQAYITKEKLDLTNEQINALISSKNILSELYAEWLDNEYLSSYSDVKNLLNLTANKISASIERASTVNDISELDKAKKYIENFLDSEYSREADFSDMQHIAIGYTEIGSEEQGDYSLQMEADLEHFAVSYYIDDELVKTEKYDSLEQMNRDHLSVLSFEDMLNVGTTELDRILEEKERNAANTELKDTDEIAKSLDLENNTITFSVVTIEGEKPFVIGSYIDKDDITDLEEYQDYIYDKGSKNIDVTVDYYTIGMGDNESYGADTDEKDYISEHLDEVLKYEYTDKLESETYFIDTPAELLEEISGEAAEKNYLFEAKNNKSQALIVNIYGGPGAGKSTTALQLAAELKKRGYNAEYVSEVAKDYVYGKRFDILDGSLAHQKQIFAEQKHRVDLMIGNVDIAITDAPLTLNTIYLNPNEKTPEYKNYILSEYNRYNNYNIYIERDLSAKFEQEGRIHNFAESIEKDTEIKSMLIDNNIPFDVCRRDNIAEIADKVSAKIEQHEPQKQKTSTYEIYQIPSGVRYRDIRFANYEQLDLMGQLPDNMNYEQVYSGNLDEIEGDNKLEGLFIKFNFRRPDDFKGHSLSVSDVVVINDENGKTAHYVDDMGFRDITDIFLERAQDTQQKEVPLTVGVIEKYGLEIDFKEIDRIILRTENEQYEGGYDSEGHERKDNFSHSTTDVSIHYSENDYSLMREDDNEDAILIGRDHIAITIDAALTEIQNFLDESFDDRDKSVYIKYDDGRTQYINAEKLLEAARAERTAEPIRRKSGSEIEVGDRFLYNDREYTVTSEKGIYPYEVGVSYEEKTGDISYEVTSNINRYKLAENGVFLANPEKESEKNEQTQENSPVGNNYEPKINDVVSIDDTAYRITNISSNIIFLRENDTLIPEEKRMTAAEFMASGFEVIEENGEPTIKSEPTAAQTETHNFVISNDDYGVSGGAKTRYTDNVAAIKTLKAIESEHRTATSEEQNILSKYTGWGAIPQAFDINNDKWRTEYAELRTLLTPDEYAAARRSTLNAHYTSPTVISAIYDGLKNLGFESGKILEPAMGTGNFFGAMPEDMRRSKLYGVELDDLTGRIAQQLYPSADIQIKGFEQTAFADNSFDVAIGNVPFGDYKVNDRRYNDNNFLIHDYFFAKALDKVHPGGIVAFVTSKGTLDKENPEVRKYLAQRAELLGAIRLPNNAFKANAGTEVTSDIIFLQKRERPIEISDETEWLKKSETADGLSVNNYFVQHPEMVLGKIVEGNKMYGNQSNDTMCIPIEGADLKKQLSDAVKNIHGTFQAAEIETAPQNVDEIPAPAESRKYAYYAVDGNLYYREAEDTMKKVNVSKDTLNRAVGLIELRDNIRELLDMQLNNSDGALDGDITESRGKLNKSYDSFVARYGNVSDRKNAKAMQGDDGYNIVSALEVKDEKGKVTGKADIFTRNTVKPKIIAEHVETAEEALILSVSEKGKVDFEFMTELCGIAKDKLISELSGQIYRLPQETEKYVTADEYLTGNIRKKIAELENAPDDMDITENKKALEAAMPPRVEAKDISVKLGAHWVDPKYIKQFILEKFKPDFNTRMDLDVTYSSVAGAWKLEGVSNTAKGGYEVRQTYGTKRKNAYEILEGILNNSDLLVKDRKKDENGIEIRDSKGNYILVTNDEETKAVRHCANFIKSEFRDWIFKDPDRREALVDKYNEVYNSIRQREYDGAHLNFVGMNTDIKLKDHQKNAVARALYGGNTLLAHAVGAGKTFEMIAIAMEGKRLGMHNKALFAVPNSLTEQMGNDFRKLYPNANILVATQKDFERKNRMQLLGKIAANDWDAVIVGHSQFDRMGLSPEREKAYLTAEIDKLREELENAGAEKSFTVKQIEKTLTKYEDKLQKINDGQVKDDFIDFEQLGFDKLFIDESHMYKNLATPTKMKNVSGLGSQGSARAFGLLMKGKYLDELTGGKGMVFASGTPVSNSMTELYTLMRYLQADTLKECGINHFDEWAADFGEVKTDYELKPESDGKYQLKTRFAKFTNLPELMGMFKECADIRTADTLNLEKPKAIVKEIVADPSKVQKRAIKSLGKRAAAIRNDNVDPTKDNMLCVTNDGRKIGLDQRLLDPSFPDDPNSKVNLCVNNVFDIYSQTSDKRSTQCIFCDLSTPKSETRQDRFIVYRPDSSKELGYDVIRKKTGIAKDMDFAKIKTHVDKSASEESDKLQNGDIAVIRRPSEDMTKIISEAAVFENGKFNTEHSDELLEKLAMSPVEDMPPKEFNVYDDIKDKLIAKGVPEKEIAFIHDYDTAEQKQRLFNQMNAGDVRVLLGSTSKCGAGMNAQKKMIALHHLDAPMRPSEDGHSKRNILV